VLAFITHRVTSLLLARLMEAHSLSILHDVSHNPLILICLCCACIHHTQGDLLAAGTSDGSVRVWALPPDLESKQQVCDCGNVFEYVGKVRPS